jgi:hypothetical protein
MSVVLSLEEARAAGLGGALGDEALQDAIDEEEAWLAARIGPLVGERTERFSLAYIRPLSSSVRLRRRTTEVELEQDGVALPTVELRADQRTVANLPEGTRYVGVLEATYTPNDELEVRRALKELLSLQLGVVDAGGVQMEQMGTYMYQRGAGTAGRTRASIVRQLMGAPSAGSLRLTSSVRHGLAGALDR